MDSYSPDIDAMMLDHTIQGEEQQGATHTNNIANGTLASSSGTWEGSTNYIDPALLDPTTFGHGATAAGNDDGMEDAPFELDDAHTIGGQHQVRNAENVFLSAGAYTSLAVHTQQSTLHHQPHDVMQFRTPARRLDRLDTSLLPTPPMSQPSQQRLNAEALSFEPGMDWQGSLRPQPHHHHQGTHEPGMSLVERDAYEGYHTPTSAASAQNRGQPYYVATDSPTPHPPHTSGLHDSNSRHSTLSVNLLAASIDGTAPASNFNGAQAGMPAVDHMQDWLRAGPSTFHPDGIPASPGYLSPTAAIQPRKKRSASHASQGSFACTQTTCPKTFATKAERDHHERYHGNKNHTCGVCGKGFHFPKDLKRHTKIHNPRDRHLMCTMLHCKYHTIGFHRQDHLDRHLDKVHGIQSARNSTRGNTPA